MLDTRRVYVAILLLGVVSLMGDVVYEGSRGIIPDYLYFLGASAFIVGLIGGLGDFLGFSVRLISGFLADTTKAYWLFIFLGYILIIAIPLLAFTNSWIAAALLIIIERIGKALRTPSRDTVLSSVSRGVGVGKAFGIHEFMDQIGAVLGPLIVGLIMLYTRNSYLHVFTALFPPYIILLISLIYTYKSIGGWRYGVDKGLNGGLSREFYVYALAVALNTMGLIPAQIILYQASTILQPENQQWLVPIIYLVIMGLDAPVALASGYIYDKLKLNVLLVPFMLSIIPPVLAVISGFHLLVLASVIFGIILGMQESIYRAAVADIAPINVRGRAYGLYYTFYGFGFLLSGVVYGWLIDVKAQLVTVITYALMTQVLAITLLLKSKNMVAAIDTPYG